MEKAKAQSKDRTWPIWPITFSLAGVFISKLNHKDSLPPRLRQLRSSVINTAEHETWYKQHTN